MKRFYKLSDENIEMGNRGDSTEIITAIDLYITRGGRIAFLEAVREQGGALRAFVGYIFERSNGKDSPLRLEWLPCGRCISSDDDDHHIVSRA
jgi:hypothetical protein